MGKFDFCDFLNLFSAFPDGYPRKKANALERVIKPRGPGDDVWRASSPCATPVCGLLHAVTDATFMAGARSPKREPRN